MITRRTAIPVVLVVIALTVVLVEEAGSSSTSVVEDSVEFAEDSYSPGDTAVFFIKDNDLGTKESCTATWTTIGSGVADNEWWNLATGDPQADVYSLGPDCAFDADSPSSTPLIPLPPPWTASVDGVPTFVDNFDSNQGRISLFTEVNASSTVVALFHFEIVDLYSASTTPARVASDSDPDGEWVALEEVASETDPTRDAVSDLFRGEVEVSADPASQIPGDGSVWVQHGDSLTATYFDFDGVTIIGSDSTALNVPTPTSTPVTPTATPTATAIPVPPTAIPTATPTATATPATPTATSTPVVCDFSGTTEPVIKGNINSDGEKIYHTPDSPNYQQTAIDESEGERWFCTVEEAEDAGWRLPHQLVPTPTPIPSAGPVALTALSGIFVVLILWRLRTRTLSENE